MANKKPAWERKGFKTRRRYEDSRARKRGFKNYAEYQKLGKDPEYKRLIETVSRLSGQDPRKLRRLDAPLSERVALYGIDEALGRKDSFRRYERFVDDWDFDYWDDWDEIEGGDLSDAIAGALKDSGTWR